jgi:hypothetical protein
VSGDGSYGCTTNAPLPKLCAGLSPSRGYLLGAIADSFLGMLVCNLDKSSLHPRGAGTKEESVTTHNRDKWNADKC